MDNVMTKETVSDVRCGDCRYFYCRERWENGSSTLVTSQCRLKPPTVEGWPVVHQDDWCGKFKQRELTHSIVTKNDIAAAKQRLQEYMEEEERVL